MTEHRPPRLFERVLTWAVPPGLSGHGTLGDLSEEFQRRARESVVRARMWYAGQAFSILSYKALRRRGAIWSLETSGLAADVRWSFRSMVKHPAFFVGVVFVLALGLGANAAVFSVVDGTLRNTKWWSEPASTVAIWPDKEFSFGQLGMYSDEQTAYRTLGGYYELAFALRTPNGESESVNGVMITPELFRELAIQPNMGRSLADGDAVFSAEQVVVIGEGLWRRSFGADPTVLGTRVNISGQPVTIVGIQPAAGTAPGGRAELWFPLVMDARDDDFWKAQNIKLVGVLAAGSNFDHAFEDLMAFTGRLSQLFPMFFPPGFADGLASVARADASQRQMISTPLLLLLAGTALLLFVTALNVGNLLLGRSIDRRKELAVRVSLGARRSRIVRQLLVEGSVLTAIALILGLTGGAFGGKWVASLFVGEATVASSPVFSPTVMLFLLCVSLLAWVVLNGVPIVHFLRTHSSGPTMRPMSGAKLQRSLVVIQAALATLLLVSATLLVATVDNLQRVYLGFQPDNMIAVELSPPQDRVATVPTARNLYDRLVERVAGLPGVSQAGLTGWLPLGTVAPPTPINLESAPVKPAQAITVPMQIVDPGFFAVFDVEPLAGRLLSSEERTPEPSAVVINQSLAELLWPDGSAVGQRIAIDPHAWSTWVPIVGVIPDVRSGEITGPTSPALYVALPESPTRDFTLVVRTTGPSAALMPALQRTVREVDQLVPIRNISAMRDVVRAAYATSWVMMGLLIVLAVLATGLGVIGIYAVLAHHVVLGKKEISLRMALGARPGLVVSGIVRAGILLAVLGIVIGSAGAAVSNRFLESLLYEVSALELWAFAAPAVALAGAAALAAWVPATRAGRLPPAEVLKSE